MAKMLLAIAAFFIVHSIYGGGSEAKAQIGGLDLNLFGCQSVTIIEVDGGLRNVTSKHEDDSCEEYQGFCDDDPCECCEKGLNCYNDGGTKECRCLATGRGNCKQFCNNELKSDPCCVKGACHCCNNVQACNGDVGCQCDPKKCAAKCKSPTTPCCKGTQCNCCAKGDTCTNGECVKPSCATTCKAKCPADKTPCCVGEVCNCCKKPEEKCGTNGCEPADVCTDAKCKAACQAESLGSGCCKSGTKGIPAYCECCGLGEECAPPPQKRNETFWDVKSWARHDHEDPEGGNNGWDDRCQCDLTACVNHCEESGQNGCCVKVGNDQKCVCCHTGETCQANTCKCDQTECDKNCMTCNGQGKCGNSKCIDPTPICDGEGTCIGKCATVKCAACYTCDPATGNCVSDCKTGEECKNGVCVPIVSCDPAACALTCNGKCNDLLGTCQPDCENLHCVSGKCQCTGDVDCPKCQTCDSTTKQCSAIVCKPSEFCSTSGTGLCECPCNADECKTCSDTEDKCIDLCTADQTCESGTCVSNPPNPCPSGPADKSFGNSTKHDSDNPCFKECQKAFPSIGEDQACCNGPECLCCTDPLTCDSDSGCVCEEESCKDFCDNKPGCCGVSGCTCCENSQVCSSGTCITPEPCSDPDCKEECKKFGKDGCCSGSDCVCCPKGKICNYDQGEEAKLCRGKQCDDEPVPSPNGQCETPEEPCPDNNKCTSACAQQGFDDGCCLKEDTGENTHNFDLIEIIIHVVIDIIFGPHDPHEPKTDVCVCCKDPYVCDGNDGCTCDETLCQAKKGPCAGCTGSGDECVTDACDSDQCLQCGPAGCETKCSADDVCDGNGNCVCDPTGCATTCEGQGPGCCEDGTCVCCDPDQTCITVHKTTPIFGMIGRNDSQPTIGCVCDDIACSLKCGTCKDNSCSVPTCPVGESCDNGECKCQGKICSACETCDSVKGCVSNCDLTETCDETGTCVCDKSKCDDSCQAAGASGEGCCTGGTCDCCNSLQSCQASGSTSKTSFGVYDRNTSKAPTTPAPSTDQICLCDDAACGALCGVCYENYCVIPGVGECCQGKLCDLCDTCDPEKGCVSNCDLSQTCDESGTCVCDPTACSGTCLAGQTGCCSENTCACCDSTETCSAGPTFTTTARASLLDGKGHFTLFNRQAAPGCVCDADACLASCGTCENNVCTPITCPPGQSCESGVCKCDNSIPCEPCEECGANGCETTCTLTESCGSGDTCECDITKCSGICPLGSTACCSSGTCECCVTPQVCGTEGHTDRLFNVNGQFNTSNRHNNVGCVCDEDICQADTCGTCEDNVCKPKTCPTGQSCQDGACKCDPSIPCGPCGTCNSLTGCETTCSSTESCGSGTCECDLTKCSGACPSDTAGCCIGGTCDCCEPTETCGPGPASRLFDGKGHYNTSNREVHHVVVDVDVSFPGCVCDDDACLANKCGKCEDNVCSPNCPPGQSCQDGVCTCDSSIPCRPCEVCGTNGCETTCTPSESCGSGGTCECDPTLCSGACPVDTTGCCGESSCDCCDATETCTQVATDEVQLDNGFGGKGHFNKSNRHNSAGCFCDDEACLANKCGTCENNVCTPNCPPGQSCQDGVCKCDDSIPCGPCAECGTNGCETICTSTESCGTGGTCECDPTKCGGNSQCPKDDLLCRKSTCGGTCVDNTCTVIVCPHGQSCENGQCECDNSIPCGPCKECDSESGCETTCTPTQTCSTGGTCECDPIACQGDCPDGKTGCCDGVNCICCKADETCASNVGGGLGGRFNMLTRHFSSVCVPTTPCPNPMARSFWNLFKEGDEDCLKECQKTYPKTKENQACCKGPECVCCKDPQKCDSNSGCVCDPTECYKTCNGQCKNNQCKPNCPKGKQCKKGKCTPTPGWTGGHH